MKILKTILLAATSIVASYSAQAQTTRPFNWSGVYLGAYGGIASPSGTYTLGALGTSINGTGFAGGG